MENIDKSSGNEIDVDDPALINTERTIVQSRASRLCLSATHELRLFFCMTSSLLR